MNTFFDAIGDIFGGFFAALLYGLDALGLFR